MKDYSNRPLHIVAMDVPFPPDYGGVIDVFYKVKALSELGIKIYLHCFQYGREQQTALEQYCEKVYYYPRKTGLRGLSFKLPYMMYSRRDNQLLHNLVTIEAPILLEGVHCAYYLNHPALLQRKIFLRNQNIETDYFKQLQYRTSNLIAKAYYYVESKLLERIERKMQRADAFLTVSEADYEHFKKMYPSHIHAYIPSFTEPFNIDDIPHGKGKYILYQGNLGHPENHEAARYIISEIAAVLPEYEFVFAGKSPQPSLMVLGDKFDNVRIVANPSMETMDTLLLEAHIHLLFTFQATGLKLKLLAAIRKGRFIIANNAMLQGSNLEHACIVANTAVAIQSAIKNTMPMFFLDVDSHKRKQIIKEHYAQENNALRIAKLAFD
jgi:hypothetical protein